MSLSKYSKYRSSLGAYLQINDIISEDNLGLNLCIMVIISKDQGLTRREFLANLSQKNIGKFLVNFQTRYYRVFTKSYIMSLQLELQLKQ